MEKRIAIVGWAQLNNERRKIDKAQPELVYDVMKECLENTGLTRDDIDSVVEAGCDVMDGKSISNVWTVEAAGGFLKDESKIEEDASFAVFYNYMRLLTGPFQTGSTVSYGKSSESLMHYYTGLIFEPFFQRPIGLDSISAFGLQAAQYMTKYGITEEQAAKVAVKNRKNAKKNPYAQIQMDLTVDDVLKSAPISTPLKLYDCCPITDGASALILATEERAKEITDTPVWIKGVASCNDAYFLGYRDLADQKACGIAAKKAYEMAGIKDPLEEIDVAEISEVFSFQELMLYEAIGFCGPGEGGKLIDEGVTEMGGKLPVNPSGGVLSANPTPATGLTRLIEGAMQVAGKAGDHQVPGVKTALVHGTSGLCFQANVVYILGRD